MPKNNLGKLGFTLIELLVSITIVAILAGIGVSVYSGAQASARDSKRKLDINAIADSMELYFGHFKGSRYAGLCQSGFLADLVTPTYACDNKWFTNSSLPQDPTNSGNFIYYWCSTLPCTDQNKVALSASGGQPPPLELTWFICANLEKGGSYCRENRQ